MAAAKTIVILGGGIGGIVAALPAQAPAIDTPRRSGGARDAELVSGEIERIDPQTAAVMSPGGTSPRITW